MIPGAKSDTVCRRENNTPRASGRNRAEAEGRPAVRVEPSIHPSQDLRIGKNVPFKGERPAYYVCSLLPGSPSLPHNEEETLEGNMHTNTYHLAAGRLLRVWRDKRAQDLVEYALLAAFLTVAVAAIFPMDIAPNISAVFSKVVVIFGLTPSI